MYAAPAKSETWTYIDGDWYEGNVAVAGPLTHAMWCGSSVFDGARVFEGVAPDLDLHCERINRSARNMGLEPTLSPGEIEDLVHDGMKRFEGDEAVYVRPIYWADSGAFMGVPPDPASTRFLLCLFASPMLPHTGFTLGLSTHRKPTPETAPTDAKAGALYPNNGRAIMEVRRRGFDNALMLDMLGNVAETGTSNIFIVKDGVVKTPAANGCFLAGITRSRVIGLLRGAGNTVQEAQLTVADFNDADEIFSSGNHSKVVSVTRFEDRELQPGPIAKRAREFYWEWAHDG